ncbi:VOC family protein [Oceanobacillus alkalisoli]|uniref:VOC family protein n=1 Tax=Oceanobacillus alkalisoli TaxID=2925113 RepID=UPI001EE45280|nr:VOC family protein [Oceanobacillus alkalisoli]MCG5102492.1 VOC family protein [Oceanobacillus alkalisoli]
MIHIEQFHHVSLSITKLEKAKSFYGNILGFEELDRPDFDFPGAWYKIGNQQLHLIVYNDSETLRSGRKIESKDGHFAIRVRDYYETLKYLEKAGVDILLKPESKSGFAQIFCQDPDGNIIEFNVEQSSIGK